MFTYTWLTDIRQRRADRARACENARARYQARPGKGTVAFALATARKTYGGSHKPVYEAHFADNTVARFHFASIVGKPFDVKRARRIAARLYPEKVLQYGFIEQDIPGEPWLRVADDTVETMKPRRIPYKQLLENLVSAVASHDATAIERARNEASEALAA